MKKICQGGAPEERKERGGNRRRGVHRRRRIRPEMLAEAADSGERFLPPGGISGERERVLREGVRGYL
jgi:hypothetical protein